ncbi:hypothetical protein JAAARDRAFT_135855, partial [Jaapia argillacea MUCL 33604]
LRKLAVKIIYSTTKLLPEWYKKVAEFKLSKQLMPRDVSTRWNSTFDMIDFALEYRVPLDAISSDCNNDLQAFELTETEWLIAKQLQDILKDATLFFSQVTPNLATVIPAMDIIDETFMNHLLNHQCLDVSIHVSVNLAKKTLNHYYDKTDLSEIDSFLLPLLVLHPCHKLAYFKRASWLPEWITTTKEIIHNEYKLSYPQNEDLTEDKAELALATVCCQ